LNCIEFSGCDNNIVKQSKFRRVSFYKFHADGNIRISVLPKTTYYSIIIYRVRMVNDLEPVIYVIDRRGLEATVIIIVVVVVTGNATVRDYFINNGIIMSTVLIFRTGFQLLVMIRMRK